MLKITDDLLNALIGWTQSVIIFQKDFLNFMVTIVTVTSVLVVISVA